jgi:hypothetical protein
MADNKSPEQSSSSSGAGSGPSKVGMYDRPASADRKPMTMIIAIVVILATILSVAFFYFF